MPKTKISEFSATPANNTDIDSINIAEGCAPSGINDAIRELMAQLKDFQTGAVGDSFNGPVGTTTAAAGAFTTLSASSTLSVTGAGSIQGLTVGRGAGAVASNTAVGASALAANTTGAQNTAIGIQALQSTTSGENNTAVGRLALRSNTTGNSNTAVGRDALQVNTTGSENSAVGLFALYSNTTGASNTALGTAALQANTTASENTAVGYQSAYLNTTGAGGTAMGRRSMYSNTTGSNNSAFGLNALYANTTGGNNTAIGYAAMEQNTTASNNTAVGYQAGYNNTTGTGVTALGTQALYANTTGIQNTAIGTASLALSTTASFNTAIGYQAGYGGTTGEGNTILGYQAGYNTTTSNYNVFVGMNAGNATTGAEGRNTFVGMNAGQLVTTGIRNTIVGRYNGNESGLDIRTASGYIVLADGSGNVEFTAKNGNSWALPGAAVQTGTGITFPATQNASANANTLDDYEEGTWTPVYTGGGVSPTYSEQTGRYIKIGQMVYISFRLVVTASSGGSGALRVAGLPFTSSATGSNPGFIALTFSYGWNTAETILTFIPSSGSTSLDAYTQYAANNSNTQTTVAAINAGGTIYIIAGGCYQAAA